MAIAFPIDENIPEAAIYVRPICENISPKPANTVLRNCSKLLERSTLNKLANVSLKAMPTVSSAIFVISCANCSIAICISVFCSAIAAAALPSALSANLRWRSSSMRNSAASVSNNIAFAAAAASAPFAFAKLA